MSLLPTAERFWPKVDKRGADECWPWKAGMSNRGYGYFWSDQRRLVPAHRVSWELANKRPVPQGMFVCHSCDNKVCVNPAHLWAGTAGDNTRDMYAKGFAPRQQITHCPQGHPYDEENTYRHNGRRHCRTCRGWTGRRAA